MENPRVRLSVLISRRRLDRDLADGLDPSVSRTYTLRARQLTDTSMRRRLARSLRRAVWDTDLPASMRRRGAVEPAASQVTVCGEGLLGLADLLEWPGAINACSVARIKTLLTDGPGPLYCERAHRSLLDVLWWVADGGQKCPPHAWDSPVIMKTDPEHVAWTCSRCGAIATSNDRAIRPA